MIYLKNIQLQIGQYSAQVNDIFLCLIWTTIKLLRSKSEKRAKSPERPLVAEWRNFNS